LELGWHALASRSAASTDAAAENSNKQDASNSRRKSDDKGLVVINPALNFATDGGASTDTVVASAAASAFSAV
jgi:hypothetical protein